MATHFSAFSLIAETANKDSSEQRGCGLSAETKLTEGMVGGDQAEAPGAHFVNSLCLQKVNVSGGLCCACSSAVIALCQVVRRIARKLAGEL